MNSNPGNSEFVEKFVSFLLLFINTDFFLCFFNNIQKKYIIKCLLDSWKI